jgi:hypothetical protein
MDINTFGLKHHLIVCRDSSDYTDVIRGRKYNNLYEYGESQLALMILPGTVDGNTWGAFRRTFVEAGMEILQDGDAEGSTAFDPANLIQSELAIKACGARKAPKPSSQRRAQLLHTRKPFSARPDYPSYPGVAVA